MSNFMLDCVCTVKHAIVVYAISASRHPIICVTVSPIPVQGTSHAMFRTCIALHIYEAETYGVPCFEMAPERFFPTYGAPAVPGTEGTMATDAGASSDLTLAFPDETGIQCSRPKGKKMRLKGDRGCGGRAAELLHHPWRYGLVPVSLSGSASASGGKVGVKTEE